MDDVGLSETEVFRALHDRLNGDARYDSGRILSSMCSEPLDIAKKVYILALEKNLGDKSLFPGSAKIERETIAMLGKLLSNPDAAGHIVSGGTEANIMALWVARHLDRKGRREVVLPESAHFSFDTAADLLGLTLVKIPLGDDFSVDPVHISRAVGQNTLAIVGLAGSTGLGKVDPILELSEMICISMSMRHSAVLFCRSSRISGSIKVSSTFRLVA
jgi:tyrosine decarboxylase/aspartate 1-decarboxylase